MKDIPTKITGTWTKISNNQKLVFELNKSQKFDIKDFYKK
jgi:hypothetical protein